LAARNADVTRPVRKMFALTDGFVIIRDVLQDMCARTVSALWILGYV
jgi:hypothetical protein